VDTSQTDGSTPGGFLDWKARARKRQLQERLLEATPGPFNHVLEPRYTLIARGARLTPERLSEMNIRKQLLPKERRLVEEMLFNREAALAWDFSEVGRIYLDVAPPQVIRTVEH